MTVVIPVRNRAETILQAVSSVLDQTYQDFEVVVVDDGSTDDPAAALSGLGDARVRLIRQERSGANRARNRGIDEARATVVAMLDSDDRFLPHHLEAAMDALGTTPDRVIYGRIMVDRGNGSTFLKPPRSLAPGENMSEYLMCGRGFVQTSTVVLHRELAGRVRYTDGLAFGQDTDFAIRLAHDGAQFHMLGEPSAIWRDVADGSRISARPHDPDIRRQWLESVRPMLTERAYHGDRGWVLAKYHARRGDILTAIELYWKALQHRCYAPGLAATIGLQIVLPDRLYRLLADLTLALGRHP